MRSEEKKSKLLVANWKMRPASLKEAKKIFTQVVEAEKKEKRNVVMALPFVYLDACANILEAQDSHAKVKLGAQDVFWEDEGAYTGEISSRMLKSLGVECVIIGHSERRTHLKESDEMIAKKINAALQNNLQAILCVGEPKEVRERGVPAAKNFIKKQIISAYRNISTSFAGVEPSSKRKYRNLPIIAYEPIWAISSSHEGSSDTPKDAQEMAMWIKNILNVEFGIHDPKVLYGGSVSVKNATSYLEMQDIDGLLVGSSSINPKEFTQILRMA